VIWWLIPLVATLIAWIYTRTAGSWRGRTRPRPDPGSPADARDLERFARALRSPLPDGRR
jgi:hypothetical protein